MFGFLGDLMSFAGAIKALVMTGALGAMAGLAAVIVGRIIGGATGIVVAVLVGATIVGGMSASDYYQRSQNAALQERILALQAEARAKATSLALANASKAELEKAVAESQVAAEHNEAVMEQLKAMVTAAPEGACGITAEELELIDKLE